MNIRKQIYELSAYPCSYSISQFCSCSAVHRITQMQVRVHVKYDVGEYMIPEMQMWCSYCPRTDWPQKSLIYTGIPKVAQETKNHPGSGFSADRNASPITEGLGELLILAGDVTNRRQQLQSADQVRGSCAGVWGTSSGYTPSPSTHHVHLLMATVYLSCRGHFQHDNPPRLSAQAVLNWLHLNENESSRLQRWIPGHREPNFLIFHFPASACEL